MLRCSYTSKKKLLTKRQKYLTKTLDAVRSAGGSRASLFAELDAAVAVAAAAAAAAAATL